MAARPHTKSLKSTDSGDQPPSPRFSCSMEQPAPTGPDAADEVNALLASVALLFKDGVPAFA